MVVIVALIISSIRNSNAVFLCLNVKAYTKELTINSTIVVDEIRSIQKKRERDRANERVLFGVLIQICITISFFCAHT